MVFNLALHYVQNSEDAEEITQDVFVSIFKSLDEFNKNAKVSTWIYRITINKSLDFLKAKNTKKRFGFLTSLFHVGSNEVKHDISTFDHPGVQLESKEAIQQLFSLINTLPDKCKEIFILSRFEHLSYKEIATLLGISVKTVENQIGNALKMLRKNIFNFLILAINILQNILENT